MKKLMGMLSVVALACVLGVTLAACSKTDKTAFSTKNVSFGASQEAGYPTKISGVKLKDGVFTVDATSSVAFADGYGDGRYIEVDLTKWINDNKDALGDFTMVRTVGDKAGAEQHLWVEGDDQLWTDGTQKDVETAAAMGEGQIFSFADAGHERIVTFVYEGYHADESTGVATMKYVFTSEDEEFTATLNVVVNFGAPVESSDL